MEGCAHTTQRGGDEISVNKGIAMPDQHDKTFRETTVDDDEKFR
jgi:hypothetical protein